MIRFATAHDLENLLQITNHHILNSFANYDIQPWDGEKINRWWQNKNEKNFPIFIAESNGQFAGFGTFGTFREKEGFVLTAEHSIYLWPQFQQQGLGGQLLARLIEEAKNRGIHSLIGGIDSENQSSIKFHEKLGFKEVGRIPQSAFKFDRWCELVLLQKFISK